MGLRGGGGWTWSVWAGECGGGNRGVVEVGAKAWWLGDGKKGVVAAVIGARAADGDGSETVADSDDDDVTCGGSEEETTDSTGLGGSEQEYE
ncbi:hypothetical protein ACFX16_025654 [Malus domestica]